MENQFKSDLDFLNHFYNEEIRDSINVIEHYLNFLADGEKREISGDSLYIEKTNETLVIGNLFDDEFPKGSIKSEVFVNFLEKKRQMIR
jgi:hypothetical protein